MSAQAKVDWKKAYWAECDKSSKAEAERAAALAVIEQMREALKHLRHNAYKSGANMGLALDVADEALALQPDTSALRKRDADVLRKAAREAIAPHMESKDKNKPGLVVAFNEISALANRIENGDDL